MKKYYYYIKKKLTLKGKFKLLNKQVKKKLL